jgi:hypothetical protein
MKQLPTEILERIFWYCDESDILKWKELVPEKVFLCKAMSLLNAAISGDLMVVKYLVEQGANIHGQGDDAPEF